MTKMAKDTAYYLTVRVEGVSSTLRSGAIEFASDALQNYRLYSQRGFKVTIRRRRGRCTREINLSKLESAAKASGEGISSGRTL